MTAWTTARVSCDALGCDRAYEGDSWYAQRRSGHAGPTIATIRAQAKRAGWKVALPSSTDLCPTHATTGA